MSLSGISSSSFVNYGAQYAQHIQQELQQLGTDLESGNLSAAQSDFNTLMPLGSQPGATSSTQSSSPITQDFNQLGQDLQSGNLSAAQQDYTNLQQTFESRGSHMHHHHPRACGGGGETNNISQLFQQLGQQLQSGSLSGAQQAYGTLMEDFQQFGQNGAAPSTTALPTSSNNVSLIA